MNEIIVRFNEVQTILGQGRWIFFILFWIGFLLLNVIFRMAGKTGSDNPYAGLDWLRMIFMALLPAVVFFRLIV